MMVPNDTDPDADVLKARKASQLLAEIEADGNDKALRLKHELSRDCANLAQELSDDDDSGTAPAERGTL